MTPTLKNAFDTEMTLARHAFRRRDYQTCYRHLERAHILGQRHYLPHVASHYWMLKTGLRTGDVREILGQLLRMAASAGSLVGSVPIGNTGRAAVPALQPMQIPDDLRGYFSE